MDPAAGKAQGKQEETSREADIRTRRNQSTSPLLRPAAEIRNIIYTHSLSDLEIRFTQIHKQGGSYVEIIGSGGEHYAKEHVLALSQTCRQTHSDTALLVFSLNRIIISYIPYRIYNYAFESRLSLAQRKAVDDLCIETDHIDSLLNYAGELASFIGLKRITVAVVHYINRPFNDKVVAGYVEGMVGGEVQTFVDRI